MFTKNKSACADKAPSFYLCTKLTKVSDLELLNFVFTLANRVTIMIIDWTTKFVKVVLQSFIIKNK